MCAVLQITLLDHFILANPRGTPCIYNIYARTALPTSFIRDNNILRLHFYILFRGFVRVMYLPTENACLVRLLLQL